MTPTDDDLHVSGNEAILDDSTPRFDADNYLQDQRVFRFSVGTLDGWVEMSLDPSDDPEEWARVYATAAAPQMPEAQLRGGIAHLASATRILRTGTLPATALAKAYQADPASPVEALWALSMVPIEYASGPLEEAVRTFERQGRPVGTDERELLTLPAGQAARVRNARAQRNPGRLPWRGQTITDGVTYLIQPSIVDDFRIVLDTWWTALELGDGLALHSRLMAESLEVAVKEDVA